MFSRLAFGVARTVVCSSRMTIARNVAVKRSFTCFTPVVYQRNFGLNICLLLLLLSVFS